MEGAIGRASDEFYAANMERTLKELRRMVKEHEDALSQLKDVQSSEQQRTAAPQSAKDSLDIMAEAYQDDAQLEPFLPFPDSVLPALLALRKTHRTIAESREYLSSQEATLQQVNRRLEAERANVEEQKALQQALEKRIQSLRDGLEQRREMTQEQIAKERLEELRKEKNHYEKETSRLLKAFNQFIDDHLGTMLAAEELGGPVVGDLMEIDAGDLGAGFSAQGKLKKGKKDGADQDTRQRRIDDIWGNVPDQQGGQAGKRKRERDEASAAGAELRDLTEKLLNSLMESGGNSSAAYVTIPRESAAARFLVRSKVAMFHPKDATRLRLVDFGRDVDD